MDTTHGATRSVIYSTLLIVWLLTNCVFADCDSTANTHYPTYNQANYEGSGHTDTFECAITGSKQLSIEQINERLDYLPPKLVNRWYFRIGLNAAAEGLTSASNTEVNNTATQTKGTLLNTAHKIASNTFEIALGYTWSEFAMDLEWLSPASVNLSTPVYNVTPNFNVNSTVKGDALLLNLYWIMQDLYNFKLYGDFIAGYSDNSSTTYINSAAPYHEKWKHLSLGLGAGARFNLVSRFYADIKGRYILLGKTRLIANDGNNHVRIKASRTWMGASVCLLWLF